jgi:hypothetical protein
MWWPGFWFRPYYGYPYAPYGYPYGGYGYPYGPMPKEQEVAMLEERAKYLEGELGTIRGRLEELKK